MYVCPLFLLQLYDDEFMLLRFWDGSFDHVGPHGVPPHFPFMARP